MNNLGGRAASVLIGLATAIVIVALTILPFLSPAWVAFEQGRAEATAWTGYTTEELRVATDAILADLVFGGDFAVEVTASPSSTSANAVTWPMSGRSSAGSGSSPSSRSSCSWLPAGARDRGRTWRAVRGGAIGLSIGVVIAGVVGFFAFDQLFELFHKIFFPAGSYLFDPLTDRLVQLFPFTFWFETAMVVGAVIIGVSLVVAFVAGRRAAAHSAPEPAAELAAMPEPGS